MKRVLVILWLGVLVACVGCAGQSTISDPVIGITSVYKVNQEDKAVLTLVNFAYVEAVADIPPSAYGQEPHETVKPLPPQRYDFERKLITLWLASGKPVLGVCLGMQFTNVVAGGTLIQDIPSQVGTQVNHRAYHAVQIEPTSFLAEILGAEEASVRSNHHQAVKDVGDGLKVVAHSEDGVIEALERVDDGFGLFVQWHPEFMDDLKHRNAIYGALVRAAAALE